MKHTCKKFLSVVLAAMMLCSLLPAGVFADECEHELEHYEATVPTCTEDGNIEYWTCRNCTGYFIVDKTGTHSISEAAIRISPSAHNLIHYPAQEPTANEPGNTEYWYCDACCRYFQDEGAENLTSRENVIIPALDPYSGKCGEDLTYVFSDGVLSITGTGAMYDFTDSAPAPWSNYRNNITGLSIGDGVTYIGENAFRSTGLTSVTILSGISYGPHAFQGCTGLTSVTISDGVSDLSDNMFADCSRLSTVTLPYTISNIGDFAFSRCASPMEIHFTGNLPDIVQFAFAEITATAYYPSCYATEYGYASQYGGSITWTSYDPSGECGTGLTWTLSGTTLTISGTGSMTDYSSMEGTPWWDYHTSVSSVVIEPGVTGIGDYAFGNGYGITSITLPEGLTYIGENAFSNVTATVYYPAGDSGYTTDTMKGYGGTLTWSCPVCFIGDTGYDSLAKAVSAAQSGDTIVLKSDVTLTKRLSIGKTLTITSDNGERILRLLNPDESSAAKASGLFITSGAALTLTGLTVFGNSADNASHNAGSLIYVSSGSLSTANVTIANAAPVALYMDNTDPNGGAILINSNSSAAVGAGTRICNCKVAGFGGGVYVKSGGTFTMTGGEISDCTATKDGSVLYVMGTASISGGTFSFSPNTAWLAEGYTVYGTGPYTIVKTLGFTGTNYLNISSDLKFCFYVNDTNGTEDLKVVVTMGQYTKEVSVPDSVSGSRKCFVYDGISPQFIGTRVKAELYAGDVLVDEFSRSILEYLGCIYASNPSSQNVIRDLVYYGLAADAYCADIGHVQGSPFSRPAWLPDAIRDVPGSGCAFEKSAAASGYTASEYDFTAANVIFDVTNTLYIRFTMPDSATFYAGGKAIALGDDLKKTGDNTYIYYLRGLRATDYLTKFNFAIKDGSSTVRTMSYGIASYAYSKNNGADGTMKELALATYRLGLSAAGN